MQQIDNYIGDSGAKMIGEALKSNSKLTKLYLYGDENREINRRNTKERGNK